MGHSRGEFVTGTGLVTVPIWEVSVSSVARLLDTIRFVLGRTAGSLQTQG